MQSGKKKNKGSSWNALPALRDILLSSHRHPESSENDDRAVLAKDTEDVLTCFFPSTEVHEDFKCLCLTALSTASSEERRAQLRVCGFELVASRCEVIASLSFPSTSTSSCFPSPKYT